MINPPKAALFDLDDTLAESFQPPSQNILDRLRQLLAHMPVAILSAAGWPRIYDQFVCPLDPSPDITHLYLFPNSSAECRVHKDDAWQTMYEWAFTDAERAHIDNVVTTAARALGLWGPRTQVIQRGSQVAFVAIGLEASLAEKRAWDPDRSKRMRLQKIIIEQLPDVDAYIGGMTTIDITKKGINKSYGVRWLAHELACDPREMLYVGDAFYDGGNDAVVIPTGVAWHAVAGPDETLCIIDDVLKQCGAKG